MVILMLGAQGTGKGTVAGILSKKTGWPQISTGDIFRKNISEKTELGIEANKYISAGNLVPDEITVPMVIARLDEILAGRNKKVDLVINLTTPRDEIIERILNRRVCSNQSCKATYNLTMHPSKVEGICDNCGGKLYQRSDDNLEAFETRYNMYVEKTEPIIDYYRKQNVLTEIDGDDTVENIFARIEEIISD